MAAAEASSSSRKHWVLRIPAPFARIHLVCWVLPTTLNPSSECLCPPVDREADPTAGALGDERHRLCLVPERPCPARKSTEQNFGLQQRSDVGLFFWNSGDEFAEIEKGVLCYAVVERSDQHLAGDTRLPSPLSRC